MRGEYRHPSFRETINLELPPRARRILARLHLRVATPGTTSACAENTEYTIGLNLENLNYLRVRGEYRCWQVRSCSARGTTSACAENTSAFSINTEGSRNYLRVRGEYILTERLFPRFLELPPRARRILPCFASLLLSLGTTSACAENTDRDCGWCAV